MYTAGRNKKERQNGDKEDGGGFFSTHYPAFGRKDI